jgi:hypothetical protein
VSTRSTSGGSGLGCVPTVLLLLVLVFVPVVGHIILTFMILGDDMTTTEKLLWLVLIWVVWVVGPLIYLIFGQRRNRLLSNF